MLRMLKSEKYTIFNVNIDVLLITPLDVSILSVNMWWQHKYTSALRGKKLGFKMI